MPSPTPWLQLGQRTLHLEELPALLERSKLLLPLLRWLVLETSISSIVVSEEDQLLCQQQFLARNNIESDEQLRAWLQSNGLSEEDASRNLIDGVRLERFKLERFSSQVERIFLDTKESRDRVVYSLLRVHDQDAAQELHLRLDEGDATFTDLSQDFSQGPERETGGLIGPVALGRLDQQLAEVLRISQPGQLWSPIKLGDWWVVIRLDKKLPAKLDADMERTIRDECFEEWLKQILDGFLLSYNQSRSAQSSSDSQDSLDAISVDPSSPG